MKIYEVALARTYLIHIKAKNEYQARAFSEYFLGDCPDLSSEKERIERKFSIEEIELVQNEAYEVYPTRD